jgi:hypothetical protein
MACNADAIRSREALPSLVGELTSLTQEVSILVKDLSELKARIDFGVTGELSKGKATKLYEKMTVAENELVGLVRAAHERAATINTYIKSFKDEA